MTPFTTPSTSKKPTHHSCIFILFAPCNSNSLYQLNTQRSKHAAPAAPRTKNTTRTPQPYLKALHIPWTRTSFQSKAVKILLGLSASVAFSRINNDLGRSCSNYNSLFKTRREIVLYSINNCNSVAFIYVMYFVRQEQGDFMMSYYNYISDPTLVLLILSSLQVFCKDRIVQFI